MRFDRTACVTPSRSINNCRLSDNCLRISEVCGMESPAYAVAIAHLCGIFLESFAVLGVVMEGISCKPMIPKIVDWTIIVQSILHETGWSQAKLAESVGVKPQTINRLARCPDQNPSYATGERLLALHKAIEYGFQVKASA